MDLALRTRLRTCDDVEMLRLLNRAGKLSESYKKILCFLGYEPMVLLLGGPPKPMKQKGMVIHQAVTYHNGLFGYEGGIWDMWSDFYPQAIYIFKKKWSRDMAMELTHAADFRTLAWHLYRSSCREALIEAFIRRLRSNVQV